MENDVSWHTMTARKGRDNNMTAEQAARACLALNSEGFRKVVVVTGDKRVFEVSAGGTREITIYSPEALSNDN